MGRKKTKIQVTTNNVEGLCESVNNKYNLKPNQIGSIEHHCDSTENSIVQIVNQFRGTRQLIYGDDKILKKYLRNILDDKLVLNFWNVV